MIAEVWAGPLALIVVAIINAATLYYMRRLERNTNSKMDQLVALTSTEAFARGKLASTPKRRTSRRTK